MVNKKSTLVWQVFLFPFSFLLAANALFYFLRTKFLRQKNLQDFDRFIEEADTSLQPKVLLVYELTSEFNVEEFEKNIVQDYQNIVYFLADNSNDEKNADEVKKLTPKNYNIIYKKGVSLKNIFQFCHVNKEIEFDILFWKVKGQVNKEYVRENVKLFCTPEIKQLAVVIPTYNLENNSRFSVMNNACQEYFLNNDANTNWKINAFPKLVKINNLLISKEFINAVQLHDEANLLETNVVKYDRYAYTTPMQIKVQGEEEVDALERKTDIAYEMGRVISIEKKQIPFNQRYTKWYQQMGNFRLTWMLFFVCSILLSLLATFFTYQKIFKPAHTITYLLFLSFNIFLLFISFIAVCGLVFNAQGAKKGIYAIIFMPLYMGLKLWFAVKTWLDKSHKLLSWGMGFVFVVIFSLLLFFFVRNQTGLLVLGFWHAIGYFAFLTVIIVFLLLSLGFVSYLFNLLISRAKFDQEKKHN
ncbi:MAG: hypothetical protein LBC44_04300 [Mycoplasmataceae bacterium]|nr:hypothetical protein [Mycoplasmataceae bacterium]